MKGIGVRKCSGEYRGIDGVPKGVSGGLGKCWWASWAKERGHNSPLGGCAPPHLSPSHQGGWCTPQGSRPLPWGARRLGGTQTLAASPPPLGRQPLGETLGVSPPPPLPLYIEREREGSHTPTCHGAAPPLPRSPSPLRSAWRSPAEISPPPPPPRQRAAGGLELLLHHHSLDRGGEGVIKPYMC